MEDASDDSLADDRREEDGEATTKGSSGGSLPPRKRLLVGMKHTDNPSTLLPSSSCSVLPLPVDATSVEQMAMDGVHSEDPQASEKQPNQLQNGAADAPQLLVCSSCQRSAHEDELDKYPDRTLDNALYLCSVCEKQKVAAHGNVAIEGILRQDESQTSLQSSGHTDKKRRVAVAGAVSGCTVSASHDAGQLRQISSNIPAGKSAPTLISAKEALDAAKAAATCAVQAAAAAKATAIAKAAVSAKAAAVAKAKLEAAALAARAAAQVQVHLRKKSAHLERGRKTSVTGVEIKSGSERPKLENSEAVEDEQLAGQLQETFR
ncbi:hypothetical protein O6H91_04G141100 [Diphasiastrum complanatum]|uniref:Uncharacterized protein n=1 Tax=Diphasiastrum complanatum TaxID=34168 RepID=A0ACC2E2J3_DIPCM|nr:hypothetical protein O6H91_04G141100 [Diphasiastrum complanatum]